MQEMGLDVNVKPTDVLQKGLPRAVSRLLEKLAAPKLERR